MKIIAKLPNAGLANKLLVWSRSVVFANMHGLSHSNVVAYPWVDFHPKRILRLDKDQRVYSGFVTNDFINLFRSFSLKKTIIEPRLTIDKIEHINYVFKVTPSKEDYFYEIREYGKLIRESLWSIVKPSIKEKVLSAKQYDVAVHIRRGDFPSELQVPISTIEKIIQKFKESYGEDISFLIFSDGYDSEFKELLKYSNVSFIEGNDPIFELLLMSKARVIIPSVRSTYSYFASYISSAFVLRHYNDNYARIRTDNTECKYLYEEKCKKISLPADLNIALKQLNNSNI